MGLRNTSASIEQQHETLEEMVLDWLERKEVMQLHTATQH